MRKPYITMRYTVIDASSLWELEESVNSLLPEGYLPLGGVSIENRREEVRYLQAMILQENPVVAEASGSVERTADE